MDGDPASSGRDAPRLLHDWGHRAQALALTMWKHEIVPGLGVCKACGRLPHGELPMFGLRCEIAVAEWDLMHAAMRRLVPTIAIGRAAVPGRERR